MLAMGRFFVAVEKRVFGLRVCEAFASPSSRLHPDSVGDWLCFWRVKQDATGMESCDSLPQRDCNRFSRFSPRSQPKILVH